MDSKPSAENKHPERMPGGKLDQPFRPGLEFLLDVLANAGPSETSSGDVVDLSFLGTKRPGAVTFDDPPVSSGGGHDGAVLCMVSDGTTGFGGIPVTIMTMDPQTGEMKKGGKATLILPEVALGAAIPSGTMIVGHPAMLIGVESTSTS